MVETRYWTFGAEHELADIDLSKTLPEGFAFNDKDWTVVNSNGIANDPSGRLYGFGGEINTPPTPDRRGQVQCLRRLVKIFPEAKVNYRSNLHIHIRVPGLKQDVRQLKQVQRYIHEHMPRCLPIIEPVPYPTRFDYPTDAAFNGAVKRYNRRIVSHQTLLTKKRVGEQLAARTAQAFFEAEVPHSGSDGRVLWHLQPRCCVSLRQMLETDTIEFRHWPGTLDPQEMDACLEWCEKFMVYALDYRPIEPLIEWAREQRFPKFPAYDHVMEVRYRATVHDGTIDKKDIADNIKAILANKFDAAAPANVARAITVNTRVRHG